MIEIKWRRTGKSWRTDSRLPSRIILITATILLVLLVVAAWMSQ